MVLVAAVVVPVAAVGACCCNGGLVAAVAVEFVFGISSDGSFSRGFNEYIP